MVPHTFMNGSVISSVVGYLTLEVLVTTVDALGHF